jgi:hypothetical protein
MKVIPGTRRPDEGYPGIRRPDEGYSNHSSGTFIVNKNRNKDV